MLDMVLSVVRFTPLITPIVFLLDMVLSVATASDYPYSISVGHGIICRKIYGL